MKDVFAQFQRQLLSSEFGELRNRQKAEWMAKVSAYAYHDERKQISSQIWKPTAERLLKKARLVAAGKRVEGRTKNQQSQFGGE